MNTKTINEIQDEIIGEFTLLDDWMDRYQMIIEMGAELDEIDDADKVPENIIEGCQSRVWIKAQNESDGTMSFKAGSDAVIVRGIISMLLKVLNHQKVADIATADLYFIDRVGLREHLSPTRSNGLLSMVRTIKMHALAAQEK